MKSCIIAGQLIYLDSDNGEIRLKDRIYQTITTLSIDDGPKKFSRDVWERLMGSDVEAVVIDDKASNIYIVNEEE